MSIMFMTHFLLNLVVLTTCLIIITTLHACQLLFRKFFKNFIFISTISTFIQGDLDLIQSNMGFYLPQIKKESEDSPCKQHSKLTIHILLRFRCRTFHRFLRIRTSDKYLLRGCFQVHMTAILFSLHQTGMCVSDP